MEGCPDGSWFLATGRLQMARGRLRMAWGSQNGSSTDGPWSSSDGRGKKQVQVVQKTIEIPRFADRGKHR